MEKRIFRQLRTMYNGNDGTLHMVDANILPDGTVEVMDFEVRRNWVKNGCYLFALNENAVKWGTGRVLRVVPGEEWNDETLNDILWDMDGIGEWQVFHVYEHEF